MVDLVLLGGRVLDPESGLDAIRDVAVTNGTIVAVTLPGTAFDSAARLDVSQLVVAPGFIDLHSHLRSPSQLLMQALDGVTTALDLEAGAVTVAKEYAKAAETGMPVNYGYSASWAMARMEAAGLSIGAGFQAIFDHMGQPAWQVKETPGGRQRLLDRLEGEIRDGGLGIGVLLGYAPGASRNEYQDVAELAARLDVPTFTHARGKGDLEVAYDGVAEVVTAALVSGSHAHVCHINSTSQRALDRVHQLIASAVEAGVRVSVEAYPYGAGATAIGAAFIEPDVLASAGLSPQSVVILGTGERPANARRLRELRAANPAQLVLLEYLDLDQPNDEALAARALLFQNTAIASDALPAYVVETWPIDERAPTHPRTTGTFCRALRWLVRDLGSMSLIDVVRRATLRPAEILAQVAPNMALKGRVQVGADADLVVFDPLEVSDRSSYGAPCRTSVGMHHVLVNGTFVVRDRRADPSSRPGRAIRGRLG